MVLFYLILANLYIDTVIVFMLEKLYMYGSPDFVWG